jgi:hypothetical protein
MAGIFRNGCLHSQNVEEKNMKIAATWFLLMLMIFSGNVFSGQLSEIELVDGGVILGEIISQGDGVYVVRSDSLGTLKVKESQIRLIRVGFESSAEKEIVSAPKGAVSSRIQSLQKSMMNNDEVMGLVLSLQKNPKMQELLKDPDIMKAVSAGDITTLMSNPKFIELLNNPEIKEIQKKVLTP